MIRLTFAAALLAATATPALAQTTEDKLDALFSKD